jgi:hypothetical protein
LNEIQNILDSSVARIWQLKKIQDVSLQPVVHRLSLERYVVILVSFGDEEEKRKSHTLGGDIVLPK